MKLTLKLLLVFTLVTLGALAVNTYFSIEREKALFDADMRKDAHVEAATLAEGVEIAVALPNGVERASAVVRHANEAAPHLRLRWVSLEDRASALDRPAVPFRDLDQVRNGKPVSERLPGEGAGWLVTYAPIRAEIPGEGRTAIELAESLTEERSFIRGTITRAIVASAALFVLAVVATAFFGVAFVGRPLRKLRLKARRAGSGDLSEPLLLRPRDELRDLADELNTMCDHLSKARRKTEEAQRARIAALEQVRRADRLATVGQLAAGIAHEMGTPLAVIAGRAKMIATGEARDDEGRESARIVAEQAHRIVGIIRQLLDFSRKRPPDKSSVELIPLAKGILGLLDQMARLRGVTLAMDETQSDAVRVVGDAGQLQQAVTNIIVNAIQATPRDGRVEVSLALERLEPPLDHGGAEAEWLRLSVSDTGAGMDAETMAHVFEPFFTTKGVGEGTGLGLAVTHGIVREHDGWVDVESVVGKGTRFSIYLPRPAKGGA